MTPQQEAANKLNNVATNLEWATYSWNKLHAELNGTFPGAKRKKVIDSDGVIYDSINAVAQKEGMVNKCLSQMLNGTRKNKTKYRFYEQ